MLVIVTPTFMILRQDILVKVRERTEGTQFVRFVVKNSLLFINRKKRNRKPKATIDQINAALTEIKNILDDYSKYMNAVDEKPINKEGNNKLSLLEYAHVLALENDSSFPHYLTLERFVTDIQYFTDFRNLIDLTGKIQEKLWNMTIQSANIVRKEAMTA